MKYTCKQGDRSGGIFQAKRFTGYRNLKLVNQLEYLLKLLQLPLLTYHYKTIRKNRNAELQLQNELIPPTVFLFRFELTA
jgi:hypothetical protein